MKVKKDVIWTCNVSATQELIKKVEYLEQENNNKTQLINELITRIEALENA